MHPESAEQSGAGLSDRAKRNPRWEETYAANMCTRVFLRLTPHRLYIESDPQTIDKRGAVGLNRNRYFHLLTTTTLKATVGYRPAKESCIMLSYASTA